MIPASLLVAVAAVLLVLLLRRVLREPAPPPTMTLDAAATAAAADAPLFPANGVRLSYLAEGAANIVYRLSPTPVMASAHPSSDTNPNTNTNTKAAALTVSAGTNGLLLRLRKALPSTQPSQHTYAYMVTTAFPMFPAHLLIPTTLVRLPPTLLASENARLLDLEAAGRRPARRAGLYLEPAEAFGFLVRDMTPLFDRQVLVEFKPKWVVQSPSAPKHAHRCRTCALRARRAAGLGSPGPGPGPGPDPTPDSPGGPGSPDDGLCPLDLASGDPQRVRRAVGWLLPAQPPARGYRARADWPAERRALGEKVAAFLLRSELMPVLKRQQRRLDPAGPLGPMPPAFLDAMTLRDLTVFLLVDMDAGDGDGDSGVQCGIGDLDIKTKDAAKEAYWRETERELIERGWYDGGEARPCQL